jgi:hypothetical protein
VSIKPAITGSIVNCSTPANPIKIPPMTLVKNLSAHILVDEIFGQDCDRKFLRILNEYNKQLDGQSDVPIYKLLKGFDRVINVAVTPTGM